MNSKNMRFEYLCFHPLALKKFVGKTFVAEIDGKLYRNNRKF